MKLGSHYVKIFVVNGILLKVRRKYNPQEDAKERQKRIFVHSVVVVF